MSAENASINITLNGEIYAVSVGARLSTLIGELSLKPSRIAVELNRSIVPKAQYDAVTLSAGDQVEIINFVGGG